MAPEAPGPSTQTTRLLRILGVLLVVPAAVLALNVWAPMSRRPAPLPTPPSGQPTTGTSHSDTGTTSATARPTGPSLSPTTYLSQALDYIEANGLRVDARWPDTASAALRRAADAKTTADTYPALAEAARTGGGPDSLLLAPAFVDGFLTGPDLVAPQSDTTDGITELSVPASSSWDPARELDQSGRLFEAIATAQPTTTCGWIVNLSGVDGLNPWPTLSGLSPLLPEGPLLWLTPTEGPVEPVVLSGTEILVSGRELARVDGDPPLRISQPVAVIVSSRTAQAGIAAAVALTTTARHRTFGATATGIELGEPHRLPDGALLFLQSSRVATRDGQSLASGLKPDVVTGPQAAEDAARAWVRAQCS